MTDEERGRDWLSVLEKANFDHDTLPGKRWIEVRDLVGTVIDAQVGALLRERDEARAEMEETRGRAETAINEHHRLAMAELKRIKDAMQAHVEEFRAKLTKERDSWQARAEKAEAERAAWKAKATECAGAYNCLIAGDVCANCGQRVRRLVAEVRCESDGEKVKRDIDTAIETFKGKAGGAT